MSDAAPKKKLLVVVAQKRTGSTALGLTLSRGATVHSFGEVFHSARRDEGRFKLGELHLDAQANFFNFKVDAVRGDPALAHPSEANQSALFDGFMEHLASLTDRPWMAIDVKYNSWLNFEPVFSAIGHAPFLLRLLRGHGAAILHLKRRRTFERHCSEELAMRDWRWHAEAGSQAPPPAGIVIDPESALQSMDETHRQMALFDGYFRLWPNAGDLAYEDMFGGEGLSAEALATMSQIIGEPCDGHHAVPLRKVTPPLAGLIENRQELARFFRATPYAAEVAQALDLPLDDGSPGHRPMPMP